MRFTVHETESRMAIKDGKRTIAYVQIGAEEHAGLLGAAPQMLEALKLANAAYLDQKDHGGTDRQSVAIRAVRAAIEEAEAIR